MNLAERIAAVANNSDSTPLRTSREDVRHAAQIRLREGNSLVEDGQKRADHVRAVVSDVIEGDGITLTSTERAQLVQDVADDLVGLGPLEPFLRDSSVTEIMVNGPRRIYVERAGLIEPTAAAFDSDAALRRTIDRMVTRVGRRIDEASPMVDARLPDGSRINVVLPPLALDGPSVTIRKFSASALTMPDLIAMGTLSHQAAQFLGAAVRGRLNILVSGATGCGKSTTLGALSAYIGAGERIVTIEDTAELRLEQQHVVRLESRPPNIEQRGEITIRSLVRNALRMRPDRIVLGEVRDDAAIDMLAAMSTGHDGSLCTVHANGPRDALARIETMVLMGGVELPLRAVREQLVGALHLIVHQHRLRSGKRAIVSITEITGIEGDVITLQELFATAPNGELLATGIRPQCLGQLLDSGSGEPTLAAIFTGAAQRWSK